MSSSETIVAVVGTGSAGSRHLQTLRRIDGVQPLALARRKGRLQELAAQDFAIASSLGAARVGGARLCIIATDTRDHADDARRALDNGMDVLVEKPLTSSSSEAQLLAAYARSLGRQLFVAYPFRFSPSLRDFQKRLDEAGPIQTVHIECQSYLPDWRPERPYKDSYSARAADGGVLRDLIHEIDYAGWLFGWPEALTASLKNTGVLGIESEEIAELNWTTSGGIQTSIRLDYLTRPTRRRICAQGEKATISWNAWTGTVEVALNGASLQTTSLPETADDLFLAQDRTFVENSKDDRSPLANSTEGIKALAICDAARRSSVSGRNEIVEYSPGE